MAWNNDGRWDMGADLHVRERDPSVSFPRFCCEVSPCFLALRKTSIDMPACVCV